MELSAPSHMGAQAAFGARLPEQNPNDVTRVNPSENSDQTGMDPKGTSKAVDNAILARELKARQDQQTDKDRHVGPSPSFEVSLLEVEQDLKQGIARMEAARGRERDAPAVASARDSEADSGKTNAGSPDEIVHGVKEALEVMNTSFMPDSEVETAMGVVFKGDPSPA